MNSPAPTAENAAQVLGVQLTVQCLLEPKGRAADSHPTLTCSQQCYTAPLKSDLASGSPSTLGLRDRLSIIFAVFQSLSHVQFFVSSWTPALQVLLSSTISQSFPDFAQMSVHWVGDAIWFIHSIQDMVAPNFIFSWCLLITLGLLQGLPWRLRW